MKKLISYSVIILIVCGALFAGTKHLNKSSGYFGGNVLTIYNWGDYIDPELIDKFEKETGYKVVYETFDSNEAMITKVRQGGTAYDISIPSEYTIEMMKEENLLIKLDHSKIKGLENIDKRFLDLDFDHNNEYSIPYFWGTLGIVYNRKMLDKKELHHWDDLWDAQLKNDILLIDGPREIMGLSLNSLGYSLNDKNENHLKEAKEKLNGLTGNIKAIVADEIKLLMSNNEAAVAVTFSGEAAEMLDNNEDLTYVVPTEGSNLWFDNIVIPKTAKNIDGAYAFINFMLEPENAAQNAQYIGYATPNIKAIDILPKDIVSDEQFYPDLDEMQNLEVYSNLGKETLGLYNDLFLEFKIYKK